MPACFFQFLNSMPEMMLLVLLLNKNQLTFNDNAAILKLVFSEFDFIS